MPDLTVDSAADAATLTRVHEELLVPSFPAEERGTLGELLDGVRAGTTLVWVARDAEGGLRGTGVVCTWPHAPDAALLAWLAVGGAARSRGTGSTLLRHLLGQVGPRILLAEIEPAERPAGDPAHGDPRDRVRFYHRHGARRLVLPYWQPATSPTTAPVRLDLVVVPPPGDVVAPSVRAGPVRRLLEAYALAELPPDLAGPIASACSGEAIRTEPLVHDPGPRDRSDHDVAQTA